MRRLTSNISVWNSLRDDLHAQQDYVPFKQGLKTSLSHHKRSFIAIKKKQLQRKRTLPSSLSSRCNKLELSVTSLTLTIGNGMLVVKSPWVSQLSNQQPHRHSLKGSSHVSKHITKNVPSSHNIIKSHSHRQKYNADIVLMNVDSNNV